MPEADRLRFVHLSDIHFSNKVSKVGFDPDQILRECVVADVKKLRAELGDMTAILVSGDIAYAGKKDEYDDAANWLDAITAAAGCDVTAVWMCPGNHDVDQDVIRADTIITDTHNAVRSNDLFYDKDTALTKRLSEPSAGKLLYSPMKQYNEFAARYESSFSATKKDFAWERDFKLNDGTILRLRALNTALLSDLSDNEGTLFLGSRACSFPKRDGVEYMTIAHHPPSWLADKREAERQFDDNVRVQMFGHEHDQRVLEGKAFTKLFAGSINPHRAEPNWKPGYNIIEISVDSSEGRKLVVDVHAREWHQSPPQFRVVLDRMHNSVHSNKIELEALPADYVPLETTDEITIDHASDTPFVTQYDQSSSGLGAQVDFRQIVFRFFRLTISKKNEIVGHLRLVEDDDTSLADVEKFRLALARARERNKLEELMEWIEKLEGLQ